MPIGPWELVIVLLIVVVIFGAGRLSEIGGAFGRGVREFKKATHDEPAALPPTATAATTPGQPVNGTTTVTTAGQPVNGTTTVATTVVENKCPSCGTLNRAEQSFCSQCGTRLTVAA